MIGMHLLTFFNGLDMARVLHQKRTAKEIDVQLASEGRRDLSRSSDGIA